MQNKSSRGDLHKGSRKDRETKKQPGLFKKSKRLRQKMLNRAPGGAFA